jgi:P27 family predicted phage terminase small subunit
MAKPGPKPKSTVLHLLQGTLRTERHGKRLKSEPVPIGTLEVPPDWLTPRQQDIWAHGIRDAAAGQIRMIDASVFLTWVIAVDAHRTCAQHLNEMGGGVQSLLQRTGIKTLPDGTKAGGHLIQSPLLGVMNRQAIMILKAASELGFSPTSRPRLSVGDAGEANPFARWAKP